MTELSLREIFAKVDKPADKWSRYFGVYQRYLEKYQGKDVFFIEVGVADGGSLKMWSDFFGSGSKIIGIDNDANRCSKIKYKNSNIDIVIGDQGNPYFWDEFLKDKSDINIFLDDGGHQMHQQILTFDRVFPKIKSGGIYICEDVHTSYMKSYGVSYKHSSSYIEYMKNYIDLLNYGWIDDDNKNSVFVENLYNKGKGLSSIHFYDSMVVVEKENLVDMFQEQPDNFKNYYNFG